MQRLTPRAHDGQAFRYRGDADMLRRCREVGSQLQHLRVLSRSAEKFRTDLAKGQMPSPWLSTQERLIKLLVTLCRQLRLSPLARTPHKNGKPEAVDINGNGHAVSAYELMRLSDDTQ